MGALGNVNSVHSALSQPHHRPISSNWPRLPRPGLVGLGVLGCRLLAGKHTQAHPPPRLMEPTRTLLSVC